MKLPFDKNYMKIVFHVVIAFMLIVLSFYVVNFLITIVTDPNQVLKSFFGIIGNIINVFFPLFIAFIIAYLLDPVVDFYQNKWDYYVHEKKVFHILKIKICDSFPTFKKILFKEKKDKKPSFLSKLKKEKDPDLAEEIEDVHFKKRTVGTIFSFISVFAFLAFAIKMFINSIANTTNGSGSITSIVSFINYSVATLTTQISNVESQFSEYLSFFGIESITETIVGAITKGLISLLEFFSTFALSLVGSIGAISGFFITLVLSIVLCFYMLQHKDKFKYNTLLLIDTFLPDKFNEKLKGVFGEIHEVFSGYIRGTLTDASIMAVLLTIGLSIVGVPFATVIAFISGFSNVIPFVGAFVGFVLAVISSLLTGDMNIVLGAIIVVFIIQQLDSLFIAPNVVGNSVEISPFLVLLSLSVGSALFGMLGMVVAVPVTAIIKIFLTRFILRQNETKSFKTMVKNATTWKPKDE
ncbi:MAG: AI-2E family transporter [Lachnospirales bacterium]